MKQPLQSYKAIHFDGNHRSEFTDHVIEETAIALVYNGTSHAVMMATPSDLEDFALGFSLSERIVATPDEFLFIEAISTEHGLSLEIKIPQQRFDALIKRHRNITAASACGMCGIESLQTVMRPAPRVKSEQEISAQAVFAGVLALAQRQPLNQKSGGVHAAGFVTENDMVVREDVGRHNALDKVIGALAAQPRRDGFLVMSSRASYELVHKAAMANISLLAAISAPTSKAIELAEACGITLIGFARGEQMNVYTHPQRLI